MDPKSFVSSAVLLLVVASLAVALFRHFGLGSIVGLLVAGIIVGPHTPGPFVTTEVEGVRQFTEIGVVLLLFLIGLEMKPRRLWEMRRVLFGLGSAQIVLTGVAIAAWFAADGLPWLAALLVGASFALSSTAFVGQMLRDQAEIASRHGQMSFAILLMQDLAVVPLLALIPAIANTSGHLGHGWPVQIAMVLAVLLLVYAAGRYLVPRALDYLARKNNREGFFLVAMAAMFIAAMAMDHVGMSMALGAFLMGVMLSTSRYSLQIEATIEPHKGLLMSLFFVAVGMSVDVGGLLVEPARFLLHVLAIVAIKIVVLFLLCLLFGSGRDVALRVGFLLAQGGEFGFVVLGAAKASQIIDDHFFATAVAVISLTMMLTPFLARLGSHLAARLNHVPDDFEHLLLQGEASAHAVRVIIAGYGRVGHTIGTILAHSDIPYLAFDTDPDLVARWQAQGYPVYYGDISQPELLSNPLLHSIDLAILTIDDGAKAVRAASLLRAHFPELAIVARARDLSVCDALSRVGVREAVPETLEASLRLAMESLELLGVSSDQTSLLLQGVRRTDYALVRDVPRV